MGAVSGVDHSPIADGSAYSAAGRRHTGRRGHSEMGSLLLRRDSILVIVVLAAAGAIAATVMVFDETILNWLMTVRNGIFGTVGLGLVPMVAWAASVILAATFRRRWLMHYNVWLTTAVLTIALTGAFSFFRPFDGILAQFSVYGMFTLGGSVGDAIIGSPTRMGALRLIGIGVLCAGLAHPRTTLFLGMTVGQGIVAAYVTAFMGVRSMLFRGELPEVDGPRTDTRAGDRAEQRVGGLDFGLSAPSSGNWSIDRTPGNGSSAPAFLRVGSGVAAEPATSYGTELADESDPPFEVSPAYSSLDLDDELDDVESDTLMDEPSPVGANPVDYQPKANRFWGEDDGSSVAVATIPTRRPASTETALPSNELPVRPDVAPTWQMPSIEIFATAPVTTISEDELRFTAQTITDTLAEYGVEVEVGQVRPGPTITMYGLLPGWIRRQKVVRQVEQDGSPLRDESGRQVTKRVEQKTRVKVDSILAREKDLALALKTQAIRIETPAMGKSLVGIEVPNPTPSLVTLRSVMESKEFQSLRDESHLPIALGRGSGGDDMVFDLTKMPHLLVAGATGSGKSFCLNAIVSCLITEKNPNEVRLLLVDPKRVELTPYNGIPHLMAPVVVETDTVVGYLKGLIREMFDRYRRMEEVGVRNIESYNNRMPDKMPFLVVVVDELADLMMTAAFDVEQSLCRLAQLGRATGIHLIIATQRPSVDVVTGLIKANFPSRISFSVTSQVDSRTILDTAGAEKLLGRGDMLYQPIDASKPTRVQGVAITEREIEDLINFWTTIPWARVQPIDLLGGDDFVEEGDSSGYDEDRDEMMDKAIELALSHRKMSTSLLQRRLRIGYPRAARLMDQLEEEGVVGPSDGSKSRDVIINQN